jgi:hypothetical protein
LKCSPIILPISPGEFGGRESGASFAKEEVLIFGKEFKLSPAQSIH